MNNNDSKVVNHNEMHNCNVFVGDTYGGIFPLPGAQVTINQHLDTQRKKAVPEQQTEGETETAEMREKRKNKTVDEITRRFMFTRDQLGLDDCRKPITNERIARLFRYCLGIGSHPTPEDKAIMEQLWTVMIDKRPQCAKEPNEDYFRQTVLNIVGHFAEKRLISGTALEIAQSIYPKAGESMAKNISRGVSSHIFPEGTATMINKYINKLNYGEI